MICLTEVGIIFNEMSDTYALALIQGRREKGEKKDDGERV
jgi:hypothetical protein